MAAIIDDTNASTFLDAETKMLKADAKAMVPTWFLEITRLNALTTMESLFAFIERFLNGAAERYISVMERSGVHTDKMLSIQLRREMAKLIDAIVKVFLDKIVIYKRK